MKENWTFRTAIMASALIIGLVGNEIAINGYFWGLGLSYGAVIVMGWAIREAWEAPEERGARE